MSGLEIVIDYLNLTFEEFQDFLEEHNVEPSEAEVIIGQMEDHASECKKNKKRA